MVDGFVGGVFQICSIVLFLFLQSENRLFKLNWGRKMWKGNAEGNCHSCVFIIPYRACVLAPTRRNIHFR